jgi:hypothetical protein
MLQGGESITVTVHAHKKWNDTGFSTTYGILVPWRPIYFRSNPSQRFRKQPGQCRHDE